jgi:uncharacterized protein
MVTVENCIAPAVRLEIEARLDAIEVTEGVHILVAVESGSRAWGFPSPHSDYDVRFLYLRQRDWYLDLRAGRDVIERSIVDEIDLSGWDIRKGLGLLLKSNAVISEWMESPIRYRPDDPSIATLREIADDVIDARALAHHYASLGRNAAARWLDSDGDVPVKKYFYALRPALAIRCLRMNPTSRPPMDLHALIAACDIEADLSTDIAILVEAKGRTNERANGMRLRRVDAMIRDELSRATDVPGRLDTDAQCAARANDFFLQLVNS